MCIQQDVAEYQSVGMQLLTKLKFILVVLTTKINFNIKETKDPMDHGLSPTVVVKSNVIILWVIIHQ